MRQIFGGEGQEIPVAARSKGVEMAFGGTQLAVSVLVGVYVGYRLDARWGTGPWLFLLGSALGLGLGMYSFLAPFFRKG